ADRTAKKEAGPGPGQLHVRSPRACRRVRARNLGGDADVRASRTTCRRSTLVRSMAAGRLDRPFGRVDRSTPSARGAAPTAEHETDGPGKTTVSQALARPFVSEVISQAPRDAG